MKKTPASYHVFCVTKKRFSIKHIALISIWAIFSASSIAGGWYRRDHGENPGLSPDMLAPGAPLVESSTSGAQAQFSDQSAVTPPPLMAGAAPVRQASVLGAVPLGPVQTWNCGAANVADVTATLNGSTMTISGTGAMANYNSGSAPWYASRTSITNVVINNGVTTIGSSAFYYASNLSAISLPASLTAIGSYAFYGSGLTGTLTIPANVTSIGNFAFSYSANLTAFSVSAGNTSFCAIAGILFNIDATTLLSYPMGRSGLTYTVPAGVTTIGVGAFCGTSLTTVNLPDELTDLGSWSFSSSGITSIVLPQNLASIGGYAFSSCMSLISITNCARIPPPITADVFNGITLSHVALKVPASAVSAYQAASVWGGFSPITAISPYIEISQIPVLAHMNGGRYGITLKMQPTNAAWTITSDQSWVTPSRANGTGDATITLLVDPCTGAARSANLTFSISGYTKTVPVRQGVRPGDNIVLQDEALTSVTLTASQWDSLMAGSSVVLNDIAKNVYDKFKDDFDFVFFVMDIGFDQNIVNHFGFYGVNMGVSNDVKGVGIGINNNGPAWGSAGKLKSVMFYPYATAIQSGPALHEICHNWANFIYTTYDLDNTTDYTYSHWGVSNAGGQLGGFRFLRTIEQNSGGVPGKTKYEGAFSSGETNPDGSFKSPGFGTWANGGNYLPYSDIELYLMGMKSAQELRDANFRLDIYSGNSFEPTQNGVFYSTTKSSYTIDDIITKVGARVPDASVSQKHFKLLTVAIGKDGASTHYYNDISTAVGWFAGPVGQMPPYVSLHNFSQATYGRGSMETGALSASLKAPLITAQPVNQGGAPVQAVAFSLVCSNAGTGLFYAWQVSANGGASWANIIDAALYSGSATGTLSIASITTAMNGNQYRCVVTNSDGNITSRAAALIVSNIATFISQPSSATINAGQNIAFFAPAAGSPAPSYQWQVSVDNGATWANLGNNAIYSSVTSGTLNITAAAAGMDGYMYRCVAASAATSATSDAATLSVNTIPVFTQQPVNQAGAAGSNVVFTAAADGKPQPTYQWQTSTDGGATWSNAADANIYGATTGTLTVSSLTSAQDNSQYRCVATNSVGSGTSSPAGLVIATLPTITTNPVSTTILATQGTTFTVTATSNATQTYRWQYFPNGGANWYGVVDGGNYSGATAATLTITNANTNMSGFLYRCNVTTVAGTVTSNAATLTVNTIPVITTQPANKSVNAGQNAVFTIYMTGNPAPTSAWQVSTDGGSTWTAVSGATTTATSSTLTLTAATSDMNNNQYRCVISNVAGSVTSNTATLTVYAAPAITTQPANKTVTSGTGATFTIAATSGLAMSYQWQYSTNGGGTWTSLTNSSPYSGVTTVTLNIASATTLMSGYQYRCLITNSIGTTTSNAATLAVGTGPAITTQPVSAAVTSGQNASFTIVATGAPAPAFQWQLSTNNGSTWTDISGATASTLTLNAVTTAMSNNQYRCVVTNSMGTTTSNAVTLTVGDGPYITAQPASATVIAGANTAFIVSASGSPTPTLQWQASVNSGTTWSNLANTTPYGGATTGTLTLTAIAATMDACRYRCIATNIQSGTSYSATSNAATLTVNYAPIINTQPTDRNVYAGQSATFVISATANPSPLYQWQTSGSGGSWTSLGNSAPYSGVTTPSMTISDATTSLSGGLYRCLVSNTVGLVTSNTVTFTALINPTTVAQQLKAQIEASGTATVTVSGTVDFSLVGGVTIPSGKTIVGADASSTISGAITIPSGAKDIVIMGVTIDGGTLNITGASDVEITHCTLTNTPVSITGGADNITFSWDKFTATSAGSGSAMTIANAGAVTGIILHHNQFGAGLKSGMPSATNARVYMFNNDFATTGNTTATVAGAGAQILSVNNVYQGTNNPLTKQSNGLLRAAGNFMTATTGATASGDDKVFVPGYSHVMQPTGIDLPLTAETLVNLITANAGNSAGKNSVTPVSVNGSASITATVAGVGATKTGVGANVPDAGGFTLTANATGFTAAKQQWYRDNFAIASATAATYAVTNANAATHAGAYAAAMTASTGELVNTGVFAMTVGAPVAPVITTHPASQTITAGGGVTFTVIATGDNLTYQWQKNGSNISGATGSSYSITSTQQSDEANYRVVVTNAGGSVTSSAATLTVNTANNGGGNSGGGSGGGGGGGGGAASLWWLGALATLTMLRSVRKK